jgi:hypothetical protein
VKKLSTSLFVAILIIGLMAGSALAETSALPGSGWWSGETIQNVGSGNATINIDAYDANGTYNLQDTILPGANQVYLPSRFSGMPAGFQGSAVVSSNSDIRAIVNITNRSITDNGTALGDPNTPSPAAGQYQGTNVPATQINFPLVKINYYNHSTDFYIQNAGSAAATATATFVIHGTVYTYNTPTIPQFHMVVILPTQARDASNNPPPSGVNGLGSLTVTSSQPLAGSALEHLTSEADATVLQATRGFSASDYDTKVFAPINKNNYFGRFTGLQVQNVSNGPIDMTVTYVARAEAATSSNPKGCPGGKFIDSATGVPAGQPNTFDITKKLPDGCFASATVDATGDVVAVVNEAYTGSFLSTHPGTSQEATSYGAIPNNAATQVISLPLYKEYAYGKGTGASIQNISDSQTAHIVITLTGPKGTFKSNPISINPGAAFVAIDLRNEPASFWNGTAMTPAALGCVNGTVSGCGANGTLSVVVTSDQPIVAIANESTYPFVNPYIHQDKSNYEGFNLATAPGQ